MQALDSGASTPRCASIDSPFERADDLFTVVARIKEPAQRSGTPCGNSMMSVMPSETRLRLAHGLSCLLVLCLNACSEYRGGYELTVKDELERTCALASKALSSTYGERASHVDACSMVIDLSSDRVSVSISGGGSSVVIHLSPDSASMGLDSGRGDNGTTVVRVTSNRPHNSADVMKVILLALDEFEMRYDPISFGEIGNSR